MEKPSAKPGPEGISHQVRNLGRAPGNAYLQPFQEKAVTDRADDRRHKAPNPSPQNTRQHPIRQPVTQPIGKER